jgi:hypothetical protein
MRQEVRVQIDGKDYNLPPEVAAEMRRLWKLERVVRRAHSILSELCSMVETLLEAKAPRQH